MAYWIYTSDSEFYDKKENKGFLYKAMVWSFVLTAAQFALTTMIFDDWSENMIKLANVFP